MKANQNHSEASYLIKETSHGKCRGIRSVAKQMIKNMHRAQKKSSVREAWMEVWNNVATQCEAETPVTHDLCLADWQKVELVNMSDDDFAKMMQTETLWHNHEIDCQDIEAMQRWVDKYNYQDPWYMDEEWEVDEWDFEFEGVFPRLIRSQTPDYVQVFRHRKMLAELDDVFGVFDMNAQ